MMKIRILSIFPDMCRAMTGEGLLKRAVSSGVLDIDCVDIRDFTEDAHRKVDDSPYGGGPGMVMKAEPIHKAMTALAAHDGTLGRVILPTPRGRRFDDASARSLAKEPMLTFICGHYEGIDERVTQQWVTDEFSIGDFVLTGGELPTLMMIDAISRHIDGVLGNPESSREESFAEGTLEYPHYTRPVDVNGLKVPDVLLSGNHEAIRTWRRRESLKVTASRRPDLLERVVLDDEERKWLKEEQGVGNARRASCASPQ